LREEDEKEDLLAIYTNRIQSIHRTKEEVPLLRALFTAQLAAPIRFGNDLSVQHCEDDIYGCTYGLKNNALAFPFT
jgi:hypothetical protein